MTATATDLRIYRELVARGLAENSRHLLGVIRDPEPELQGVPLGDVLCWCEGLGEAAVTRILVASEIQWGKRLAVLSNRDIAMVCFQIKARHPDVWERWKAAAQERRVLS